MYICECGETFDKPNNFNGHKSHCKVHLGKKTLFRNNRYKKRMCEESSYYSRTKSFKTKEA